MARCSYVLLLQELRRRTHPKDPDYELVNTALNKIKGIADYVNENKRHVENMSKLVDIQVNKLDSLCFVC